ncbi:MAG: hypothetical protein WCC26_21005 [Terracidiphilus sp.]
MQLVRPLLRDDMVTTSRANDQFTNRRIPAQLLWDLLAAIGELTGLLAETQYLFRSAGQTACAEVAQFLVGPDWPAGISKMII